MSHGTGEWVSEIALQLFIYVNPFEAVSQTNELLWSRWSDLDPGECWKRKVLCGANSVYVERATDCGQVDYASVTKVEGDSHCGSAGTLEVDYNSLLSGSLQHPIQ